MKTILKITKKEFSTFFSSPAAFLFLGVFIAVTLFVFFWVETFFARNIADVRPLFHWMPILLIFLVSALTMRSWSEERRSGSIETLLTTPIRPAQLVLGKFFAGLGLVAIALLITIPLPFIISFLGPLDWGPVIGGYVAAMFLAAAYVSIGLFMSSRTDNPIVALIMSSVVCGLFYLVGSTTLTTLFGHSLGSFFNLLGSGSRFESITRGVLDFRDLYYYISIVGIFLTLNLFTLEKLRWAGNPPSKKHRQWVLVTTLAILNFLAGNLWLHPIGWARADITQGNIYSLSPATDQYLKQLHEPLLIRGYFTSKTHPLLAPLVPQLKDLLEEYSILGENRVHVEFVDPQESAEIEEEAASKYGIKPVAFQMASKYQSSVVNSYFDILIAYGDKHEVLSYSDLIEIKVKGAGQDLDVTLKNPEYAITSGIRKTLTGYQSGGTPFDTFKKQVSFTGYMSDNNELPNGLLEFRKSLNEVLDDLKKESMGKFTVSFQNPDAGDGALGKELKKKYGFGPQIASLFDPKPFWFYMVLQDDSETIQVPLPKDLSKSALKQSIEAGLKRMAPGFLKTVTMVLPATPSPYGMRGKRYSTLKDFMSENVRIKEDDLKGGIVPEETDLLMVLAPKDLNEKQLFAIDQFLMRGGSIVMATSPFDASISGSLTATKTSSGLKKWFEHNGINLEEKMIIDAQNGSLPIPVKRYIGPIAVQEIRMLAYSYFADVRNEGLNSNNSIASGLGQVTLNWASPISWNKEKNKDRSVTPLLTSSKNSWVSDSLNITPNIQLYPKLGFATDGDPKPQIMAAVFEGRFDSYFTNKESPLLKKDDGAEKKENDKDENKPKEENMVVSSIIERSSESARIILISSNGFGEDSILGIASQGMGTQYTKPLEFIQNSVDWSLEDRGLLSIRSRSHFSRMLLQITETDQMIIEYISYGLALIGLFVVWIVKKQIQRITKIRHQAILMEA
ncbi:MAG: Gldg family protein [Magnetococcales bacterium]|nr:Gldg family protein [Magnetococcales bacterium]